MKTLLSFLTLVSFSLIVWAADEKVSEQEFKGLNAKAGDAKELVPGIAFRWCPAGSFTMGTPGASNYEKPVKVTLSRGFWLGETEVTEGQYRKLMGTPGKRGDDYPVTDVSHEDVVSFCQKLTTQERNAGRLPIGWKYSLPTEAQWEYACRAGTTTKYSFGESENQLGDYGWFNKNAFDIGEKYAHQVGKKKPNDWGLKDMHGNVWEWCSDWYGNGLQGGRDPAGPTTGSYRVYRGGGWGGGGGAHYCRSACRDGYSPARRFNDLGFRLAAVPE